MISLQHTQEVKSSVGTPVSKIFHSSNYSKLEISKRSKRKLMGYKELRTVTIPDLGS